MTTTPSHHIPYAAGLAAYIRATRSELAGDFAMRLFASQGLPGPL